MAEPTTTTTTTEPPAKAWFEGKADAETIGHMTNRGWHTKPADEVALDAIKAHREAEKLIGAPANQIIRIPSDPKDETGWKALHQRLGAPADPKEYDFAAVKNAKGEPLGEPLANVIRSTAGKFYLTKDAALAVAQEIVKHQDGIDAEKAAVETAALETERKTLAKNWGANFDANKVIVQNAAAKLKITPDDVRALEGVIGYARVMEMFRDIGTKIGEHHFVRNGAPGAEGVMSRDQAVARKGELMRDEAWGKRYTAGGAPELREMTALNTIIVGDDTDESRRAR